MSSVESANSWINWVNSREGVLGPCRGTVPSLTQFRISTVLVSSLGAHLFGSITNFPEGSSETIHHNGLQKLPVYLNCSIRNVNQIRGAPKLDPEGDDSVHGFELALPVRITVEQTDIPIHEDTERRVLRVTGDSPHLSFEMSVDYLEVRVGRKAAKGFEIYVPREVRAL